MTDRTSLGDRMKRYEAATRSVLPLRTYTIIRVDIRAAHTYLRDATRPFDDRFMNDMDAVAEDLCQEIAGARFAFTQSDEISVLLTDFATHNTEPWFGGVVAKQVSISAALATASLMARRPGRRVTFDSRVFTLPDWAEAANYFVWRQRDAVRNSISMLAQAHFSPAELHGVNRDGMQELLWTRRGINWNGVPDSMKRGRVTTRQVRPSAPTVAQTSAGYTARTSWSTAAAPRFVVSDPDNWLRTAIPVSPGAIPAPAPTPEDGDTPDA